MDINNALKALDKSNQYSHIQGAICRDNVVILKNQKEQIKCFKKLKG